jgi:iron complex transport system substrate-binding protein
MIRMLFFAVLSLTTAAEPIWIGQPPQHVSRIVSLAPSLTEIIFALGEGKRIVGVTRFDDYPAAVKKLPRVGGFIDPDPEAILHLNPDALVAIPTSGGPSRLQSLARLGKPTLILPALKLSDLWMSITALGKLLHVESQAQTLIAQLQQQMAHVKRSSKKRVLVVVGRRPLVAAGPEGFLTEVLDALGAENVVKQGAYPHLDLEAVAALKPDVILDLSTDDSVESFWPTSVKVLPWHDERLLRLGPRLPAALKALGDVL